MSDGLSVYMSLRLLIHFLMCSKRLKNDTRSMIRLGNLYCVLGILYECKETQTISPFL